MPAVSQTVWQLTRGLWLIFAVYWIASAGNTKATKRAESAASRLSHFGLLWGGYVLVLSRGLAPEWRFLPAGTALEVTGVALAAAGVAFAIWARHELGANWSATVTIKHEHELVRRGPYAFVRNPIYTGIVAAALGTALTGGELLELVGVALVVCAVLIKIGREERLLTAEFGSTFTDYRRRVKRLIPFIW